MSENNKSRLRAFFDRITGKGDSQTIIQIETNPQAPIMGAYGYGRNNYSYGGMGGGAKYPYGLDNYGRPYYISNSRVRSNARYAYHDTPEMKALVNRFADTVVGTGLRLECQPKAEILGITEEEAEAWATDVQERFHLWAKSKGSHRKGLNTFYQNQRLYQIFQQRDNDIFVRFYYSKDVKLQNPLQISFVDPNQIRGDAYFSTYGNTSTQDGINRNEKGEEVSYKIWMKNAKDGTYRHVTVPRYGRVSKRTMMVHGFIPEYSSQGRGYSRLEHILQEANDLTDFKLSNIKKAISQSQITMYTKPSKDQDASNPLDDVAVFKGGVKGVTGDSGVTISDPAETLDNTCHVDYEPIPSAQIREPGSIGVFNLLKGEELKPFEAKHDAEDYSQFVDSYMSYVAASNGMPIEVLLMKFGQNYSASRGTLILFWIIVELLRNEMATDFLDPAFESWLSEEIAAGRIQAPGFSDPVLRQAWLNCTWLGAPMPNIDPLKAAKAEKEYLDMGATTLEKVSRDYNGTSSKNNRRKLAKEYEDLPRAPWNASAPVETQEDDEEDEDE